MGMPEFEAKRYEGKIREGRVLISVHADNSDWTAKAKQVMRDAGGDDISTASEATASKPVAPTVARANPTDAIQQSNRL